MLGRSATAGVANAQDDDGVLSYRIHDDVGRAANDQFARAVDRPRFGMSPSVSMARLIASPIRSAASGLSCRR